MSTHKNICFYGEIRKILICYSVFSSIISAVSHSYRSDGHVHIASDNMPLYQQKSIAIFLILPQKYVVGTH